MSNLPISDSEARIQAKFHQWLWNTYPKTRYLCYAIPNGGYRTDYEAMSLKATGVVKGIPDYCIAIAAHGYNSLYIEFKEPTANMNTEHVKHQKRVHDILISANNKVIICTSFDESKRAALDYLRGSAYVL